MAFDGGRRGAIFRLANDRERAARKRSARSPEIMMLQYLPSLDAIAGARLAVIDAAHLSAVERPVEFTQLLMDFWRGL